MTLEKQLIALGMTKENKTFFVGSKKFDFTLNCESCNDLNSDDFNEEKFVLSGDKILKYVFDEYENEDLKEVSLSDIERGFKLGFLFN